MTTYVVTLQCADGPGIVRAASSAIVQVGGNILENDQFTDPVTGQFCMRTRFETEQEQMSEVRDVLMNELAPFGPRLGLRNELTERRAIIMVSTADHCVADLLYRREQGDLPLDIVAIVGNHPDCRPLAERYGVPFFEIAVTSDTKHAAEDELRTLIERFEADVVILARYMQVLSAELCADLSGRAINIHHSFLPGFKGARPYHQAYERGVKIIGATAHFVTPELDEGPIIEQDVVRVTHARRPADLISLGRDIERTVLARAVRLIAEDRVALVGKRTVIFSQ
ncbi:MAG: formyltetrahydrofolate deformylase [Acidobacteria bacterium]|nr:formyltetrahydrofolate deformylase [Acidobacteriota bacterium]